MTCFDGVKPSEGFIFHFMLRRFVLTVNEAWNDEHLAHMHGPNMSVSVFIVNEIAGVGVGVVGGG